MGDLHGFGRLKLFGMRLPFLARHRFIVGLCFLGDYMIELHLAQGAHPRLFRPETLVGGQLARQGFFRQLAHHKEIPRVLGDALALGVEAARLIGWNGQLHGAADIAQGDHGLTVLQNRGIVRIGLGFLGGSGQR